MIADHGQATFGIWAKGWYVFHNACQKHWCRGNYPNENEADQEVPNLVSGGTGKCPGCQQPTPHNGHYTVRQVTP